MRLPSKSMPTNVGMMFPKACSKGWAYSAAIDTDCYLIGTRVVELMMLLVDVREQFRVVQQSVAPKEHCVLTQHRERDLPNQLKRVW
jgi:hypothetical protein